MIHPWLQKQRVLRKKIICTPSVCWNNVALVVAVECCRKEESSAWSICWDRVGVGNVLLIPLPTLLTGIRDYWGLEILNCCWFGCRSSSLSTRMLDEDLKNNNLSLSCAAKMWRRQLRAVYNFEHCKVQVTFMWVRAGIIMEVMRFHWIINSRITCMTWE